MVAIATLIEICERKRIAKMLLHREKNIKFLSFNRKSFVISCGKLYSATCLVKYNDYTLA